MDQSLYQLISPIIFFAFSIGFFALYRLRRNFVSAVAFSAGYFLCACGFLVNFAIPVRPLPYEIPFFLGSIVFLTIGLFKMNDRRPPYVQSLSLYGLILVVSFSVAYAGMPFFWRALPIHMGAAILFAIPVFGLWGKTKTRFDSFILALVGASALQYAVRAFVVEYFRLHEVSEQSTALTYSAVTFHLFSSVIALGIAVMLLAALVKKMMSRLSRESEVDPLTGLLNRRGLEIKLRHFEKAFQKGANTHAIVLCDIDHFKAVNDTYGHAAGDMVLQRLGHLLDKKVELGSIVARHGGEEFCIALFGRNANEAEKLAEQIREDFAELRHEGLEREQITLSLGVSAWAGSETFSQVLRRTDEALYEAKRNGRNQVRISEIGPLVQEPSNAGDDRDTASLKMAS